MSEHVISGLLKTRKELANQMAHHQKELEQVRATLCALDSTIRIYKPDHDIPVQGSVRGTVTRNRYFAVGEAPALLRDFFRDAPNDATPSTHDVVRALAIAKGLNYDAMDKRLVFRSSVMKTLKRACVSGWLIEHHREQGVIHWQMT